ncbi:MAG: type II secretion system F family protein [Nanoarchaeota archaeon]|nr:type II secretion system F family protein [Nanoarchaeota archaeon]MBU4300224.1 type II secretion system F family protein [Nanoarchaeota archaeon]MBU4451610.1 type II secretion system F family protein [Nanoarchaeota archaeon]MCG2723132.1 type II secretion system F family protein [archaeon]
MENKENFKSSVSGKGVASAGNSSKKSDGNKKVSVSSKIDKYLRSKLAPVKKEESDVEKLRFRLKERNLLKDYAVLSVPLKTRMYNTINMLVSNFMRAETSKNSRIAANVFFGGFVKISPEYFEPLKDAIAISDMKIIPESYIGIVSAIAFSAAFSAALIIAAISVVYGLSFLLMLVGMLIFPALVFLITFTLGYAYPFQRVKSKMQDINTNLPFAINHMAAIASSGVPPEKAFEMMAQFKEYGAVSIESRNLVRQINVFGKDILNAIRFTAMRTPSKEFKELLYGILSIIETGGNMKDYLNEMSQLALFNYKLARKKYIETLSTYADIYTAILIAAPLFLVSILAVMNMVPGSSVGGLSIEDFMWLGVYVLIPVLNVGFLLFISYTQPDM